MSRFPHFLEVFWYDLRGCESLNHFFQLWQKVDNMHDFECKFAWSTLIIQHIMQNVAILKLKVKVKKIVSKN